MHIQSGLINFFIVLSRKARPVEWVVLSLLGLFLVLPASSHAQQLPQDSIELQIQRLDSSSLDVHLGFISSFPTIDSCKHYLQLLPAKLQAAGYIGASVDSFWQEDAHLMKASLYIGPAYKWAAIELSDEEQAILESQRIYPRDIAGSVVKPEIIRTILEGLINYYLDRGYPFVRTRLDSVRFEPASGHQNQMSVRAKISVDKGLRYTIDTILIKGNAQVKPRFLSQYLNIHPGEAFNQSKIQAADRLLKNLPYVKWNGPSQISMGISGATLNVLLDKKPTNQIDALIGFMPAGGEPGGKLQVTGQVALLLKNAFGSGEMININWEQLQPQSPNIALAFQRPYIMHSPFGLDLSFSLYKKDSAYVNVAANIGTTYQFSPLQTGRIFLNLASSRLLDVDTLTIIAEKQLPEIMDVHSVNMGLGYQINTTDYRFNPRRGTELDLEAIIGNKKVKKNNAITQITPVDGFDYASLYDTVPLSSYQVRVRLAAAKYLPVGKYGVLKLAANGGLYQSAHIFVNEMFMVGGYELLRGFDEQSIYATSYGIGTLEYRYLIGQNSYFFGFSDFGYAGYHNHIKNINNGYLSFGLGMAFETKAGIFNFSLATGRGGGNSFGLNQAKVHIGYVTVF
ncbi:BamA/TamA family outer membrane protein [Arachidicoccus terrestris]|uniref:BamA/TamA family outer membrane protein n=1 Tax=Arachidicoccus terrestris TaxID=2875539 RepID=UPI001CC7D07F|nr:BamA/TamA family outer membrane protein [Arachidicoccus terrestris]UAY54555.1 BamA/TamA family outer membrane protein [Arachidicoccus terrestris]